MKKPLLIIMAAGIGSRYGGFKQIVPVDDDGHILMDYSLYDARRAGFERAVFVIAPGMEEDFRQAIGDRISRSMDVYYAVQRLDLLPQGFSVPDGRTKPWGTAQAVLSAKAVADAPFAAINADDFYGAESFETIYSFLCTTACKNTHAMVGYSIENTLTEYGHVSRGVCRIDGEGNLAEITERTHIVARPGGAAYTEDGKSFVFIPSGTIVSMNMWGFGREMMDEIDEGFGRFLSGNLEANPLKCEYYLPSVANRMLSEGRASIKVLNTHDRWYGVTYREDMPVLRKAIAEMRDAGKYPAMQA